MIEKASPSQELKETVTDALLDKKAVDVVSLDMRAITAAVADFYVIASGTSDTHIKSLAEHVEHLVEAQADESVWSKEGLNNRQWVLLDYADVVVHIFREDVREKMALEDLWGDAVQTYIEQA